MISLRSPLVFVFLLSFAAACSPSVPGQAGGSSSQSQPSGPKTLTIGILREPATIDGFTGEGGSRGGAGDAASLLHNLLTVQKMPTEGPPRLALPVIANPASNTT